MKRSVWKLKPTVNSFIIAIVAACFLVTEGQLAIEECSNPHRTIKIPEDDNQTLSFTCDGLPVNETAQWNLRLNNSTALSFPCSSDGKCDTNNPDIQISRLSATSSILTVINNLRKNIANGIVFCFPFLNSSNTVNCSLESTTTTGSQTPAPPLSTTVRTHHTSTSVCQCGFKCNSIAHSVSPTLSSSSTKPKGITTERQENEDDGSRLPVEAIGGGVAALVVIFITIIAVVVVVKRRQRQKAAGNNNDDLEEHVNPMYGSGDEPDTTTPSTSKPSGVALRIPTDTSNSNNAASLEDADNAIDPSYSSMTFGEQQTTSPASATSPTGQSSPNTASQPGFPTNTTTPVVVTDADLYTSVDGMEQEQSSGPVPDHAGRYSTVGSPNNSATAAPSGDVYAVVQKSGPRVQSASATTTVSPSNTGYSADGAYAFVDMSRSSAPASSASKATSGDPVSDNADNTYAVVNKSSSQGKGTGASDSPDTSNITQQAPSGDVYAQVDKSSKRNGSTPENDDEGQSNVYDQGDKGNNSTPVQQTQAQDQKPKPGIKPKPALKPIPSSNV